MKRETVETFPARLVELREKMGWSQQELARRAGTSIFSVSKMERGERSPSFEMACRLADALGVTVDSLRKNTADVSEPKGRGRPQKKNSEK